MAAVAEWSRNCIMAGLVMNSSPVPQKTRRVGQRCTKSTTSMSYDHAVNKKSIECPFGLGAHGKIKFPSTISHRQSSGASLWGANWASKLSAEFSICLYGTALKRNTSFRGMYYVCNGKTTIYSP
ncbi:hypothetical protein TNCV_1192681 [Trichonephila clavipes]|nr:hypothetical protein TNCV_1192681 [Trichonephila clavipes]